METNSFFSWRNDYLVVIAMWLCFQAVWYSWFGVHFDQEAVKYISEARYVFQNHHLSQFRYLFYFTTIAVIGFANFLHIGNYGALLLIMGINLIGYLVFFKALKKFSSNRLLPFLIVFFLMSFWPYQSWSMFLFTECLFYTFVLFLFSHLILFERLNLKFLGGAALILFLLVISRPLGILFILPVLLFVFFKLSKKQRLLTVLAAFLFFLLLNFVIQIVFTTTPDWNMTRALTEDSIICDMPRNTGQSGLKLSQHPNQFYQLFYYVRHNFSHFAGLALVRLRYFFTMVRTYYSSFHNIYLIAYLLLIYGSITMGVKQIFRQLPLSLTVFIFSSVLLFALTIALQCDDYHNRFFLTLMPLFAVPTLLVWQPVIQRISSLKPRRD